jgi:1,2-dihydroxy-3-keto-5-methylthiopentene dioxygenase
MAKLFLAQENKTIENFSDISEYLSKRGIHIEQWKANGLVKDEFNQEQILAAYAHMVKPFMQKKGFQTADVINVHKGTPNIEQIRMKFLSEHTHSEDEVRFFVDGEGDFWFHLENEETGEEIFKVNCRKGDFLSVPAGFKHWFDLAPNYHVKAIRIFSNQEGWTPHYTQSKIEQQFIGL